MKDVKISDTHSFALIGHSGDGKTSLGEAILHTAGATTTLGSVSEGTSHLNTQPEEKERRTTISSSVFGFEWSGKHLTLMFEAMDAGEMDRALFLLDQAQDHARRGRALPILPIVSARQAVARDAVEPGDDKAERLLRRAWKALASTGVAAGRVELLSLWAQLRAQNDDARAADILWASARTHLKRWHRGLPFQCDLDAVADACGVKRHALQPQT